MNPKEWIGRSETVSDIATATPYAALSATSLAGHIGRMRSLGAVDPSRRW